jgi:heme/copper-type cytochrome/quinol oxidase subunit 3
MNDVIHLAFLFISLQIFVALCLSLLIAAFGSIFYRITGFHGLHVGIVEVF